MPCNPAPARNGAPSQSASADRSGRSHPVVVIGAGPAGLTAAYQLAEAGDPVVVVEEDAVVGGISRTVERDGWRFDIGGHRFFTKVHAGGGVLARGPPRRGLPAPSPDEPDLLRRQVLRLSDQAGQRPLQPRPGRGRSAAGSPSCGCGSGRRRTGPPSRATSSPTTGGGSTGTSSRPTTRRSGAVSASEISADWGAQRIKGMSLWNAVWEPIRCSLAGARRDKSRQVTSLIEEFQYPKFGPGMMWERCAEQVVGHGRHRPDGDGGDRRARGGWRGGGGHRDVRTGRRSGSRRPT